MRPSATTTQKPPVYMKYHSSVSRNTQVTTDNKVHPIYTHVIIKVKNRILNLTYTFFSPLPNFTHNPPYIKQINFNKTNKQ
jgi:hypothetical protein